MPNEDLKHCLEVTRRSGSNLWLVGRTLPARRRALFVSAYASMREIDDFVDDDFAMRAPALRAAGRTAAHESVSGWLTAVRAALAGAPDERPEAPLDPRIGRGLSDCFRLADIGSGPWDALARAMHRDVDEERFVTWEDFLSYCDGATVAPASIFLYVLAARFNRGSGADSVESGLPAAPDECARDMAVFCYIVHIARDLVKDAATSANLVTIPDAVLQGHGLDRDAVTVLARSGDATGLSGLVSDLADRAAESRARAGEWSARILPALAPREAAALRAILAVYRALHDRILRDPELPLSGDPKARESLRRDALAAAGVGQ